MTMVKEAKVIPLSRLSYPSLWAWARGVVREVMQGKHHGVSEEELREPALEDEVAGATAIVRAPIMSSTGEHFTAVQEDAGPTHHHTAAMDTSSTLSPTYSGNRQLATIEPIVSEPSPLETGSVDDGFLRYEEERKRDVGSPVVIVCMEGEGREEEVSIGGESDESSRGLCAVEYTAQAAVGDLSSSGMSEEEEALQQCLYEVAVCSVRCPAYFKPLYRLAAATVKMGLPQVGESES